jgi:hypothetical protein
MTQTIKIRGFDGGEAERYFHEGKIKEIADYSESDIVNTHPEDTAACPGVDWRARRDSNSRPPDS